MPIGNVSHNHDDSPVTVFPFSGRGRDAHRLSQQPHNFHPNKTNSHTDNLTCLACIPDIYEKTDDAPCTKGKAQGDNTLWIEQKGSMQTPSSASSVLKRMRTLRPLNAKCFHRIRNRATIVIVRENATKYAARRSLHTPRIP